MRLEGGQALGGGGEMPLWDLWMALPGKGLEAKHIPPLHPCLSAGPAPTQRGSANIC